MSDSLSSIPALQRLPLTAELKDSRAHSFERVPDDYDAGPDRKGPFTSGTSGLFPSVVDGSGSSINIVKFSSTSPSLPRLLLLSKGPTRRASLSSVLQ